MWKNLNNLRVLHISLVFTCGLFVYQFSRIPYATWIAVSILMVNAPINPGHTINKAFHRIIGTVSGLILAIPIWFLVHFNYSLLFLIGLISATIQAFFNLKEYKYYLTLFTINICLLLDYAAPDHFSVALFAIDRIFAVCIGIILTQFFEYFIFRRYYKQSVDVMSHQVAITRFTDLNLEQLIQDCKTQTFCHDQLLRLQLSLANKLAQLEEIKQETLLGYNIQKEVIFHLNNLIDQLKEVQFNTTKISYKLISSAHLKSAPD